MVYECSGINSAKKHLYEKKLKKFSVREMSRQMYPHTCIQI